MRVAFLLFAALAAFTYADDPPETTDADLGEEINLDDVASLAEDSDGQTYAKDCGTLEALKANCPIKYGYDCIDLNYSFYKGAACCYDYPRGCYTPPNNGPDDYRPCDDDDDPDHDTCSKEKTDTQCCVYVYTEFFSHVSEPKCCDPNADDCCNNAT